MTRAGSRAPGTGRRRIYCETLPLEVVREAKVLDLLRRYELELVVAARPGDVGALCRLIERASTSGVRVGVWPMIADEAGRWASADNAAPFCDFVEGLVADLGARGPLPAEIAVDLEPPFAVVQGLFSSARARLPRVRRGSALVEGARALARLSASLRARGIEVSAAVVPLVLLDPPSQEGSPHQGFWQAILGTPVEARSYDHISPMLYTSMMEGLSRGLLRRRDARALFAAGCREAALRWGVRAGVSLGVVSTGALGDEPIYRGPSELAEDVADALACGVHDLTLFDLGGVLRRPPAERWLDAFTAAPPARALRDDDDSAGGSAGDLPGTTRARAVLALAWLAGRALGLASARISAASSW